MDRDRMKHNAAAIERSLEVVFGVLLQVSDFIFFFWKILRQNRRTARYNNG